MTKYRLTDEEAKELRRLTEPLSPVTWMGETEWVERGEEKFEDVMSRVLQVWGRVAERLGVSVESIRRDDDGTDELDILAQPL